MLDCGNARTCATLYLRIINSEAGCNPGRSGRDPCEVPLHGLRGGGACLPGSHPARPTLCTMGSRMRTCAAVRGSCSCENSCHAPSRPRNPACDSDRVRLRPERPAARGRFPASLRQSRSGHVPGGCRSLLEVVHRCHGDARWRADRGRADHGGLQRQPVGDRDRQGLARARRPARRQHAAPVAEHPARLRRVPRDDSRGRCGARGGRSGAERHPGLVRVLRGPRERNVSTDRHAQPDRRGSRHFPGRGRAPQDLGGRQADRAGAQGGDRSAARPEERSRPRNGLRLLLRPAGRRLRHDRGRDDADDGAVQHGSQTALRATPHLDEAHVGGALRPGGAGLDPGPLDRQPLGASVARPDQRDRSRQLGQGQGTRVDRGTG